MRSCAAAPAALGGEAPGHVIGVTGPPGRKSTLLSELVAPGVRASARRGARRRPLVRRSGGSLLGDRARIAFDPADARAFIRSTAAADRLGGLAARRRARPRRRWPPRSTSSWSRPSASGRARPTSRGRRHVVVVVQPGSGDALQFLKSGIMEIPDVLVVTKADLGDIALRARRDLHAALRSIGRGDGRSSRSPAAAGERRRRPGGRARRPSGGDRPARAAPRRAARHRARGVRGRARRAGSAQLGGRRTAERRLAEQPPGPDVPALVAALEEPAP